MNEQEIRQLYAVVVSYDNRKLSEANLTAWWEQARRNRWTLADAVDAVHQHHEESTEFLTPAHITGILRSKRRQPPHVDESHQLEAAPSARPERVAEVMGELREQLGWRVRPEPDSGALRVECPYCHAGPNRPCTRHVTRGPRGGQYVPLAASHPSRIELAEGIR